MAGYGTGSYGLGIYGIGEGSTATVVYHFEPPTVLEAYGNGYPWRITRRVGISLLKTGASYRQVRIPTDDEITDADIAYIGGYVYEIDSDERQALIDAGYGDLITSDGDDPSGYGLGAYGTGAYGS